MGGLFSGPVDSAPAANIHQPVYSWDQIGRTNVPLPQRQESEAVKMIRNPFVIRYGEVFLRTIDDLLRIEIKYCAAAPCKAVVHKHCSPNVDLTECSLPEQVPADWDPKGFYEIPSGTDVLYSFELGPVSGNSEDLQIYLLCIQPAAPSADADWTQWHFLRFEALKSGVGSWAISRWDERMKCGRQVYSVQKIFSNRDEGSQSNNSGLCLICQSEQANTMVLPCRHLCLCYECAEIVRARKPSCPVCRGGIRCMLQLGRDDAVNDESSTIAPRPPKNGNELTSTNATTS